MHDAYDWFTDIVLPAFVGLGGIAVGVIAAVGSIAVGLVAAYVARQSHNLAVQVRKDESKRDEAAARERYRDQLFQTIEPAVSALLAHRAQILEDRRIGTAAERNLLSNSIARLGIVHVMANAEDRQLVHAVIGAYHQAEDLNDMQVLRSVLGRLALILPQLLEEGRDVPDLVRQAKAVVQEAIEATTPTI